MRVENRIITLIAAWLALPCLLAQADLLPDLPRERRVTYVSGSGFGWYAKYDIAFTDQALRIYSNIYLQPISGVTSQQLDALKPGWEVGIESRWSDQYQILHANHYLYDILFDVTFVDTWNPTLDHHYVRVRPGPQRSNLGFWDTEDTQRVVAHEYGHSIGNYDEYIGGALDPVNPLIDTTSLMGGTADTVVTYARHYQPVLSWLTGSYPQETLNLLPTTGLGDIAIDIRPGSEINSVNPSSRGVLPVAILGDDLLDVFDIDLARLYLAGAPPRTRGNSGKIGSFKDLNGDSIIDLTVHFEMNELDISPAATDLLLVGYFADDTPFAGTDSIRIVPPGDVNGDGFVGVDDLTVVLTNWGLSDMALPQGDLTGDSFVGADDYTQILTYWANSNQYTPIPEPATLGLLIIASLTILAATRPRPA